MRTIRKQFYRKMGTHGFTEEDVSASLDQLKLTLKRMNDALAHGPWLDGLGLHHRRHHRHSDN